ncbi:MAG: YicC/YloC family endoribonuclease [Pseudomonadota bacterium]
MRSMTGYARVEGLFDTRPCVIEIKTVNHRFCDINLKIPKVLVPLELTIKKYMERKINRGRVDATIQMENGEGVKFHVGLNLPLAHEYYSLLSQLKQELDLAEGISLLHIISLKDVISVEKIEADFQRWDELQILLDSALNALNEMRECEGTFIKQDLQERVQRIDHLISEIESHGSQMTTSYREKLLKRFQQLDLPYKIDESRLLTEIFFLAERADITEEVVRIRSHLQQCQELLDSPIAIGRKLEFIIQEINREINTIGSKSNDVRISQAVVEVKSDVEKMREQVQNVE